MRWYKPQYSYCGRGSHCWYITELCNVYCYQWLWFRDALTLKGSHVFLCVSPLEPRPSHDEGCIYGMVHTVSGNSQLTFACNQLLCVHFLSLTLSWLECWWCNKFESGWARGTMLHCVETRWSTGGVHETSSFQDVMCWELSCQQGTLFLIRTVVVIVSGESPYIRTCVHYVYCLLQIVYCLIPTLLSTAVCLLCRRVHVCSELCYLPLTKYNHDT